MATNRLSIVLWLEVEKVRTIRDPGDDLAAVIGLLWISGNNPDQFVGRIIRLTDADLRLLNALPTEACHDVTSDPYPVRVVFGKVVAYA